MEVLAPMSSGVTPPLPQRGSAVTFCVHNMIGDAGWQMVRAFEFAGDVHAYLQRKEARSGS